MELRSMASCDLMGVLDDPCRAGMAKSAQAEYGLTQEPPESMFAPIDC